MPTNAPGNVGAVLLNFVYNATYRMQVAFTPRGSVYTRLRTSNSWTPWQDVAYPPDRVQLNIVKGAWAPNGTISTNVSGVCNDTILTCVPGSALSFYLAPHWTYSIREGDSPTDLSTRTAHLSKNHRHIVSHPYVALIFNLWDSADESVINATTDDFSQSAVVHTTGSAIDNTVSDTDIHDTPETQGVLNVISRAYQMTRIRYTALATLPMHTGGSYQVTPADVPAGTDIEGVVYSSMRETMASVPQATSFTTFMTALLNPNSYIYTQHYEGYPDGTDYNSRCFYGAVCSTMVAYCYGITDVMPTTISLDSYDGFEALPTAQQNPYSLKLGDSLNKAGDHIVIVTDIIRNFRGRIKSIEVSEAAKPLCRSVSYTPAQIQSRYFDQGFVAHRYAYIDAVPYTPSPWVHVDDTETGTPTYSRHLSPRMGDRANWRYGDTVQIDVLNIGDHSTYAIVNRDSSTTVASGAASTGGLISLTNLAPGRYYCTLRGGADPLLPVHFTVLNASAAYTPQGNNRVRVSNWAISGDPTARPSAIYWCGAVSTSSDYKAVGAFHVLTAAEISAGYVILEAPDLGSAYTTNGKWLMRMAFKTEFGLYASPLVEITVT